MGLSGKHLLLDHLAPFGSPKGINDMSEIVCLKVQFDKPVSFALPKGLFASGKEARAPTLEVVRAHWEELVSHGRSVCILCGFASAAILSHGLGHSWWRLKGRQSAIGVRPFGCQ